MYTSSVGRAANSEPAICTFQEIIWLPAMFCRATVTGQLLFPVSTTANKKSFQAGEQDGLEQVHGCLLFAHCQWGYSSSLQGIHGIEPSLQRGWNGDSIIGQNLGVAPYYICLVNTNWHRIDLSPSVI